MSRWFPTFDRIWRRRRLFGGGLLPLYTTRLQQHALLSVLLASAQDRMPLVPLLKAHQADASGVQRHRLSRLIQRLEEGADLPDALEQVPQLLAPSDTLSVRFGAQSGILAPVLKEMVARFELPVNYGRYSIQETLGYLLAVLWFVLPLLAFLIMKVSPTLRQILDDFSVDPPLGLELLIQFSTFMIRISPFLLILLVVLTLMWWFGLFRRVLGGGLMPGLSRWFNNSDTAELMSDLAVATEQGRPVTGSVSTLARYHFDRSVRHRLLYVRNEVEQGTNIWSAFHQAQLLTAPEAVAIDAAERVGNRAWVLRQLEARRRSSERQRLRTYGELAFPAVILGLGAFVLWISSSFLLCIVKMIMPLT